MGIVRALGSQAADPRGPLGRVVAWIMPVFSDAYCGDLSDMLALRPEDSLLDVACGSGSFLDKCASQVQHVAGIDHSETQIRLARKRLRHLVASGTAEIVQGDAAMLPWKDGTFSAVTCNCPDCLGQPEQSLREMYRVLRPGGRIALVFDSAPDEGSARAEEQKWGLHAWTSAGFRQMMEDAGFSGISLSGADKQMFAKAIKE